MIIKEYMKAVTVFSLLCLINSNVFADEFLWKSGQNLYIKISKQDKYSDGRFIPNQHPVSLDPRQIRNALSNILVWNKSFFTGALKKGEEAESVFSLEQSRLLGSFISAGLLKAAPNQDIVFALARKKKRFLILKDVTYTAGRAFFVNGKLNIIIGDYDRMGDKFKERANASAGVSEIKYYFAPGKRAKRSGFRKAIILADGLSTHNENGKNRKDWFVIDVKRASAAFVAGQNTADSGSAVVDNERFRQQAARSAQERREMRLEMARLRKAVKQSQQNSQPVEQRLQNLQSLREKNVITNEEYEAKRKEILDDI